ncbi:alpha-amylase [Cellulomonas fengjieae]|uniref:alpha-amylase n=1 Tax=Cellulomonas fengjieae TaxID=2819978 RepID=UPI001AAEE4C2|nr:alpha-amylase family protein [Cellulomonas fengjieae]MBO3101223.1 alpha-amylase family protein [Cellulomonas fengjieae]
MSHLRARTTVLVGALAVLAACSGPSEPAVTQTRDVGVQLFQWTWDAVAAECTEALGPAGYAWVLTSPPQEHIVGEQWWTAYQPVSHRVESRLGTREQYAAMVETCHEAGVDVWADAVVNHMTGQDAPGTGWAGSPYAHYEYPGLYSEADFHHCGLTPNDDIALYQDAHQVQTCELVNLADLATGTAHVRATVVAYLEDLLSLGVDGFRIDAAKHMAPQDVAAIVAELPEGTGIAQEVIRGSGEPVTPEQYVGNGKVYEFAYGRELQGVLAGAPGRALELGTSSQVLPTDDAVVFVDNHDTERNGSTLSYADAEQYALANVLMLAGTYGTPAVYSGYAFSDRDAGPPQDADGRVLDASCREAGPRVDLADGDWVCQHRWTPIAGMVGWRNVVGDAPMVDAWSDGDAVAVGRGERGLVVVNLGDEPLDTTLSTSLPDGRYCDVLGLPVAAGEACPGAAIRVEDGSVAVVVPPLSAQAFHVAARP